GAAILAAAFTLEALWFLASTALMATALIGGLFLAIRAAARRHVSPHRVASMVDERAELKGRLTTLVALARDKHNHSLWSYLLEDTLSLAPEFHADKIEPRHVSSSLYALLASSVVAGL